MRRPLGIPRAYPQEAVLWALRLQARTGASVGGAKERVSGVRLVATDAAVSIGDGPKVRGPALSLLMVTTRPGADINDLDGPGLVALATAT